MAAGPLRASLTFQKRSDADDDYGNTVSSWAPQFTIRAEIVPRFGSEPIIAQRLQGVQPMTIKVRAGTQTRQITPAWRAVDSRDPTKVYNLRTAVEDPKRRWIEMLADDGVST